MKSAEEVDLVSFSSFPYEVIVKCQTQPPKAEGGNLAGVPNIYLIYWARLTDSPPLPFDAMCFVTRSFYDDTDVFLYCFDMGFSCPLEKWLKFVIDWNLDCVNEHASPEDPTMHYCIYVCPVDKADFALACIKAMYKK